MRHRSALLPAVVFDVRGAWSEPEAMGLDDGGGNARGLGEMTSHASKNPAPLMPGLSPTGKAWAQPPSPWGNSPLRGWTSIGTDVDGQVWLGSEQSGFPYGNWARTQHSGSIFSDIGHAVSSVAKVALPVAATVASFVPGVGTGVALALNTANQLAQGKSLKDAAISAAKNSLPGGALTAAAFDAAVNIAQGQNVGTAALGAARDAAVAQGGPLAGAAFDAGLAAARGQNVLDAAKGAALNAAIAQLPGGVAGTAAAELMRRVVAGENVASAALAVGGQAAKSAAEKAISPMASVIRQYVPGAPQALMDQAKAAMAIAAPAMSTSLLQGPAKVVAQSLLQNPHLQQLAASQVAEHLGVTIPVVRDAIGAIVGSAQKASSTLAPAPRIAETVSARQSLNDAMSKVDNSAVAPAAATPAPGSPNPYTGKPLTSPVVLPPAHVLKTIFRHVPRAHRVPLFRLWKKSHGMPQNAGRLPVAGEQSVPPSTPIFWVVKAGQFPIMISKAVTGDERRYKELFASNPAKKLNADKSNFASFLAGEKLSIPASWHPYFVANAVNGDPLTQNDVTGGVALPVWTPKAPPIVSPPPGSPPPIFTLPPIPGLPPGLPPIFGGPPSPPVSSPPGSDPGAGYANSLPPGMLTAIKGQLGVWGVREKQIKPAGYPSAFDLMPPIGETVDENFRSAVRSFQQWKGGGLRSDGTLDKPTHDAINAYTTNVATKLPDAKTPPPLPPIGDTSPPTPPKPGDGKTSPPIAGGGGGTTKTPGTAKGKGGAGLAIAAATAIALPMILK